ncbi:MAG TPA: hypothetical protein VF831_01420 [Anaerolineales bacterium]
MSNHEPKKKLVGPWRSLHAVIWLVGLYILISRGWIFPGIFVLLAISAIYEGILQQFAPHAFEEEVRTPSQPNAPLTPSTAPVATVQAGVQEHRIDLLPQVCPSCSAPIRGHEVKWTGPQSANCPYCGTNLPMSKA